jgi:hypothetical protein
MYVLYIFQWGIRSQSSGLAERSNATLYILPLDLTSGSGFATDIYAYTYVQTSIFQLSSTQDPLRQFFVSRGTLTYENFYQPEKGDSAEPILRRICKNTKQPQTQYN